MAAPEGYTKLGNVGYADKGVYSADATYNKYNVVYYEGSTYVALKDNLHGVTPANGENWRYMAKGFNEASADGITVIDTSGIIDGTKNKKTILQTFLDKVGDFIINKAVTNEALLLKLADYVAKTDIVQTESTATDKVPSSAYLKQALGTINTNLELSSITTITDIEDSGITGQIYYRIKAGVCYINCRVTTTASATPRDGAILCRGLPEAAVGQTQYCSNGQGTINIGVIYIDNNSGVLKSNLSGKAGNGYTSFSYPIKQ